MKNQSNYVRNFRGLILALTCLITADGLLLDQASLVFAQTAGPSWTYTGNLNTARFAHTATLLLSGKVLVAGGANGGIYNSAELYDPTKGTWSVTGGLNVPRAYFTATLLPNGKVLVAGGYTSSSSSSTPTNTAELYDPATGAWSLTGNLNIGRQFHTATLLPNGKVLIVGGDNESSTLNTAELYDPETGAWSATGALNQVRRSHTATLLQNGKVLVAGGSDDYNDLLASMTSTELYDPNTGAWSVTGSLNTSRTFHTATLLQNGKVLVAGGWGLGSYLTGYATTVHNSAELYDPATGMWSYTGNLSRRDDHTATLLANGQVLVAGGGDFAGDNQGHGTYLNSAELYEPAIGTWSSTANLNTLRDGHTATLLSNGKVLVVGGPDGRSALSSAELYDSGASSVANPIDDAQFFVRQQYLDFLNREPDADGLTFWTNQITSCGIDTQCLEVKRINTSAAYFLSIEFQNTGYFVYRIYKSSFGNLPDSPAPIKLSEFLPDAQQVGRGVIVGQAGWETILESNKQTFASQFVQRSRFASAYPTSLSPAQFVDALFANAAVVPSTSDRAAAINEFGPTATTSDLAAGARALRRVVENSILARQEFNRAFVLMQYFGYLRRNPNDAPDSNFNGYNFWLNKLNSFNGDFAQAEMVKAFITSGEYRQRFGQ